MGLRAIGSLWHSSLKAWCMCMNMTQKVADALQQQFWYGVGVNVDSVHMAYVTLRKQNLNGGLVPDAFISVPSIKVDLGFIPCCGTFGAFVY